MHTVEVRANILEFDENSVDIQVDCNYTVISTDGVNLTISINKASGSQLALNKSLLCEEDKATMISFQDLQQNTMYYVVALWTGNDFHERSPQCTLSMPPVEFETVANSQGNRQSSNA